MNRFVPVRGARVRYVVEGAGPDLVLLHTLRTQLEMFHKVLPALAEHFRVYALDYPGHGHSDAPDARYDADFFVESVGAFLDQMPIERATLVGESIGGTIALVLAARHHPRVASVVAINPYDYNRGRGLATSSPLARVIFTLRSLPLIGAVARRINLYFIVSRILLGGVERASSFPPSLLRELYTNSHPQAFDHLVSHWPSWEAARAEYGTIAVPVDLVYGDHDWSRESDREADQRSIPGARMTIVPHARHFLALDDPRAVIQAVTSHAGVRYVRGST
jgi:pimeloyl-ACP methyl ester carboxylesterase